MRYSLPLGVEPKEEPTQPRRYLIQSLDGKQIKKDTFVRTLRARKDRKMLVLLLEPERVLSPLEKELLNPKTIVIRTFDYAFSWHHGNELEELPSDYVRKIRALAAHAESPLAAEEALGALWNLARDGAARDATG